MEPLFRIWDNEVKKYVDLSENLVIDLKGNIHKLTEPSKIFNTPRYFIERCTGYQDNSLDYIYEGDIVKIDGKRCVVVFEFGTFVVECLNEYETYNVEDIEKIIGNEKENQELLLEEDI